MKIAFILLTAVLVACSCGETKKVKKNKAQTEGAITKATIGELEPGLDEVKIKSAKIEGNTLIAEITYGGGCEKQELKLIGSKFLMKSLPPKRGINLMRDSKGDICKKLIEKTVTFDISDLAYKQEEGSKIVLLLNGYDGELIYTYSVK